MRVHLRLVDQRGTPQPRAGRRERRQKRRSQLLSMRALPHLRSQRIRSQLQGQKERRRSQLASMQVHLLRVSCQLYLYSCQVCCIEQDRAMAYRMLGMC